MKRLPKMVRSVFVICAVCGLCVGFSHLACGRKSKAHAHWPRFCDNRSSSLAFQLMREKIFALVSLGSRPAIRMVDKRDRHSPPRRELPETNRFRKLTYRSRRRLRTRRHSASSIRYVWQDVKFLDRSYYRMISVLGSFHLLLLRWRPWKWTSRRFLPFLYE